VVSAGFRRFCVLGRSYQFSRQLQAARITQCEPPVGCVDVEYGGRGGRSGDVTLKTMRPAARS